MFDLLSKNVPHLFTVAAVRELQKILGVVRQGHELGQVPFSARWKRTLDALLASSSHEMLQMDEANKILRLVVAVKSRRASLRVFSAAVVSHMQKMQ